MINLIEKLKVILVDLILCVFYKDEEIEELEKELSKLQGVNQMEDKEKDMVKEVYLIASDVYGEDAQIAMVFEKMAELQKELCKYIRSTDPFDTWEIKIKIAEEISDVEIMLEQIKLLFEIGDAVDKNKVIKVNRLKERLERL